MPTLSVRCRSCGLCCRNAFVLPEEKDRIADSMGFLKSRHIKNAGDHFIIEGDPCPFLSNGECSIEQSKPVCCRVFPLVLESKGSGFFWKISEECPLKREIPREYVRKAEKEGQRLLEFHNRKMRI